MRNSLVVANWKMHGQKAEVTQLLSAIKDGIKAGVAEAEKVVICPPTIFLGQVDKELL